MDDEVKKGEFLPMSNLEQVLKAAWCGRRLRKKGAVRKSGGAR